MQQEQIKKLQAAIDGCYARERELVSTINTIGAADADPKRDSETADKIRALDAERRESVINRRKMQAGVAQLRGDLDAMLRRRKGQTSTVKASIEGALAALEETEAQPK